MNNKAVALDVAETIEKAYKGFGVGIKILSVKTGSDECSFVFLIKFLKGTRYRSIAKYAEDVRMSAGFATLIPLEDPEGVCLAVATKACTANGLLRIWISPLL